MISENKKIAKNTIVVYINLFVSAVVGLYTSRLVLQALGVSDYGLYNVGGGVVALCAFFFCIIINIYNEVSKFGNGETRW